jgi:23S rRNA (adenine2030-N6)-methyltransferase
LVLCDPSYEIKSDYGKVLDMVTDSLKRFRHRHLRGVVPHHPRPEAHDLPRRLKTLATKAGKSWLHATLTVKSSKVTENAAGKPNASGLPASGMFLINPPFTLKPALKEALPPNGGVAGARQARHLHAGIGQLRNACSDLVWSLGRAGVLAG